MSGKYETGNDPACYPGTEVLKNKLGLRDQETLAAAEAEFAAAAVPGIEISAPPFDLGYLRSLHRQLFDEVYDWAGQVRDVKITKGKTVFCLPDRIVPETARLLAHLASLHDFRGLERARLVEQVAELYGELNVVHPFREGNGRTLRLFFEHLILVCGFAISWQRPLYR